MVSIPIRRQIACEMAFTLLLVLPGCDAIARTLAPELCRPKLNSRTLSGFGNTCSPMVNRFHQNTFFVRLSVIPLFYG